MTEILHAWALAPAAIGTCCLAADRRRVRAPELAASVLMLIAMLDAAVGRLVAPVLWGALLIAAAMGLAGLRSVRRADRPRPAIGRAMTVHTTVGLIVMAALLLTMAAGPASSPTHAHGMSAGALSIIVLLGVAAYCAASVIAAVRAHSRLDRAQFVAMGLSTAVMGLGLIG